MVVEKFKNLLKDVESISGALMTNSGADEFKNKRAKFETLLERSQYVKVPLVGIFNAGKSSALNIYVEKPGLLPVDTTPETAVAYELYYSTDERVELYRSGELIAKTAVTEIKSLPVQPGDVAFVYVDSQPVKQLQDRGIILVDMPGIGSGNQNHDEAIMNYIEFGTAFIMLMDAEQGALKGSTLQFVEELKKYSIKSAFLISKIDKKPASDIQDIIDGVKFDVKRVIDEEPYVGTICAVRNDLNALTDYIYSLDPESLLVEKVGAQFKNLVNSVIADLDNQIEDKGKSVEEAKALLETIEKELDSPEDILESEDLGIRKSPDSVTEEILENISVAIKDKTDKIARMVINKSSEDEINAFVSSIIRSELISTLKDKAQAYSMKLSSSVNDVISKIAHIKVPEGGFSIDLGSILDVISLVFPHAKWAKALSKWGRALLEPLQALIEAIFGKSESEKLSEVKSQLNTLIIKIVNELRDDVRSIVNETLSNIDNSIKEDIRSSINKKKETLRNKLADAQVDEQKIKQQIDELNQAKVKLSNLINEL